VRTILVALAIALTVVPGATAADTDRVQVGGSNSTQGFSRQTYVTATSPDGYVRKGFDGDHGDWRGPLCVVSSNSSLSGEATVSWTIAFSKSYRTAEEAADQGRTFRDLPLVQRAPIEISHVIRGREVGKIASFSILAATREEYGWAELGLGIPLTQGVFAAARFWSTGPSFRCTVSGVSSDVWHRQVALAAAKRVVVDGNLPAARVSARAQGRRIAGAISDGFGHPLVGVRVTLERKVGRGWRRAGSATTDAGGRYGALVARGLVRAAVGSRRSAPVRVR
jgi:hypothetical protein